MITTRRWRGVHRRTSASWAALATELQTLRETTVEQRLRLAAADDLIACLSAEREVLLNTVLELEALQVRIPAQEFSKGVRAARQVE
ncbi:hypothetical protein GCM10010193_19000 [Kitasatospora atroaurantiaca]|uniref:hypothetical protein n=1 Tax=Kitasatospora atroaurantiaca TaxID=285545 RepID=UPI0011A06EBE|nr:hypothetical protein [Kitasatospora atroaurantiaca]